MRTHAATVPDLAAAMLPGPYRVPAYRAVGHIRLTNKTPGGTYRAPGRYESTFVRERLMDAIAAAARPRSRRRAPAQSDRARPRCPITRPLDTLGTEVVLDSGDYAGLLDKALARDRAGTQLQARSRAAPRRPAKLVGVGAGDLRREERARPVRRRADRRSTAAAVVEVVTGAASVGQGVETVIAQICADALGVDYRRVRVVHGQTDRIAYGMGAFASRVTVMTGEATRLAAVEVRAQGDRAWRPSCCRQPAEALDVVDGKVVRKGAASGPSITLGEIAAALAPASRRAASARPGCRPRAGSTPTT